MGRDTHIGWTQDTWNWARGCTKKNEDCKFCYMMRDGDRWGYDGNAVVKTKTVFNLPNKIESGRRIMVSSLTDIFHESIDSYRHEAYEIMRKNNDKTYQFISKRWERAESCLPPDWGDGWNNVWLGFSAGSQRRYDEMMPYLKNIKSKTKWVSLEPLTKPIDNMKLSSEYKDVLNWVVVGGESGNGKIPNDPNVKYGYRICELEWIENIVKQCKDANIPVFVKQLGTHLARTMNLKDRTGSDINEFPKNIQYQQFPK